MKTIILKLNTTEMGAHEKSERGKKRVCVSPLHLGQLLNFHKEILYTYINCQIADSIYSDGWEIRT